MFSVFLSCGEWRKTKAICAVYNWVCSSCWRSRARASSLFKLSLHVLPFSNMGFSPFLVSFPCIIQLAQRNVAWWYGNGRPKCWLHLSTFFFPLLNYIWPCLPNLTTYIYIYILLYVYTVEYSCKWSVCFKERVWGHAEEEYECSYWKNTEPEDPNILLKSLYQCGSRFNPS